MQVHEGRLVTPLTTPPRVTRPLRHAAADYQASFLSHNLTLPSGFSPIAGTADSPATALEASGSDVFLSAVPHGSPSPRPQAESYYRPHVRRAPPAPHKRDHQGSEDSSTYNSDGSLTESLPGERGGHRAHLTSSVHKLATSRLSQVLSGERQALRPSTDTQAARSLPSSRWRASLPPHVGTTTPKAAASPTGMRPPTGARPAAMTSQAAECRATKLANTGLNASPSPARGTSTSPPSMSQRGRPSTAPPTPAGDAIDVLERAQRCAQEAQDQCTRARAKALQEEHALRQALEEEARLSAEVRRLEATLTVASASRHAAVPSPSSPLATRAADDPTVPYVYDDVDRRLKNIAGPLHTPGPGARAQQRWEATHVPLPGTLEPLPRGTASHASTSADLAALEQAIDHRYRLSKLVVALDEERQRTKYLRARHAHLLEAHQQRMRMPSPSPSHPSAQRSTGASPTQPGTNTQTEAHSEAEEALEVEDGGATKGHVNDHVGTSPRHGRASVFCGASSSPEKNRLAPFSSLDGHSQARAIAEIAEDVEQVQRNLVAMRTLASSHRTKEAAAAITVDDLAWLVDSTDRKDVAQQDTEVGNGASDNDENEASSLSASQRAALGESRALCRQFAQLIRAGEEERQSLVEYYQLLLARLAQRMDAVCRERKATSAPAPIPSEDDRDPIKPRSRIVSWF